MALQTASSHPNIRDSGVPKEPATGRKVRGALIGKVCAGGFGQRKSLANQDQEITCDLLPIVREDVALRVEFHHSHHREARKTTLGHGETSNHRPFPHRAARCDPLSKAGAILRKAAKDRSIDRKGRQRSQPGLSIREITHVPSDKHFPAALAQASAQT